MLVNLKNMVRTKSITFEEIAYEWLQLKKNKIKESTYYNYLYCIRKYLMNELSNLTLNQLKQYDFNKLVEEKQEQLSAKTVKDIICILKAILNYIDIQYDCNIRIKTITSPKEDREPLIILNDRERNRIERYCIKENTLESIGILICLYTGLRIGEICALRWKDIELDKKELHVRHTLQRVYNIHTGKTEVIIGNPKTLSSKRVIPISNKLHKILKAIKKRYNKEEFLLTGEIDRFIEPRCYRNIFSSVLKKCKIKKYKFHILRHTFATKCIDIGMDVKTLSEILGHSNVEITLNKYVHSSYRRKKMYLEKL